MEKMDSLPVGMNLKFMKKIQGSNLDLHGLQMWGLMIILINFHINQAEGSDTSST